MKQKYPNLDISRTCSSVNDPFFSEGRGGDAPSLRRLPSVGVDPAEGRAVAEEGRGQDQRGGEFPHRPQMLAQR